MKSLDALNIGRISLEKNDIKRSPLHFECMWDLLILGYIDGLCYGTTCTSSDLLTPEFDYSRALLAATCQCLLMAAASCCCLSLPDDTCCGLLLPTRQLTMATPKHILLQPGRVHEDIVMPKLNATSHPHNPQLLDVHVDVGTVHYWTFS